MAVRFRIQHLSHGGSVISTHTPVGGTLDWSYVANEVGNISYQLPLSDINIGRDSFGPYKTDWRLQQRVGTGSWESIMGGLHTSVNLVENEDTVNIAGKDWAHWLEQPVWFDFYDYNWNQAGALQDAIDDYNNQGGWVAGATGNIYDGIAALVFLPGCSQSTIIDKLLEKSRRGPNYVNISPVYTGTAGSSVLENDMVAIIFQDPTTYLQHINNVAALDDPYGYDWTINANKTMEFFGPRKTITSAPTPIWTITKGMLTEQPMMNLDWTNNGPLGTHIVGLSVGSPALWWKKRDQESVDLYRDWLMIENVGDQYIKGPDMRYAVDGLQYIFPQKDVKVSILPEVMDPFTGFKNHVGDTVKIIWDFPPYHEVNATYWITEQSFSSDPAGNWICDLGLQQIYSPS